MLRCSATLVALLVCLPVESLTIRSNPPLEPAKLLPKIGCFEVSNLVSDFAKSPVLQSVLSGSAKAMSTSSTTAKLSIVDKIVSFAGNPFGDGATRVMDRKGLRVLDHGVNPLAKYKTIRKLGEGAFGGVYLVMNLETHEHYAMKIEQAVPNVVKNTAAFSVLPCRVEENSLKRGCGLMQVTEIIVYDKNLYTFTKPLTPLDEPAKRKPDGNLDRRTWNQKFFSQLGPNKSERVATLKDRKPDNIMLDNRWTLKLSSTGIWIWCRETVKTHIDFGNSDFNPPALRRAIIEESVWRAIIEESV